MASAPSHRKNAGCANAIGRQTRSCSMINPGYISPWIHSARAFYSSSQKLQTQRQPAFVLKVQVVLKLFWTGIKKTGYGVRFLCEVWSLPLGLARSEHQPGLKELPGSVCNAHSKFKNDGKEWKENITLKYLEATQVLQPAQEKCIILLAHGAMIWLLPVSWLLWPTASCGRLGCTGYTGKS